MEYKRIEYQVADVLEKSGRGDSEIFNDDSTELCSFKLSKVSGGKVAGEISYTYEKVVAIIFTDEKATIAMLEFIGKNPLIWTEVEAGKLWEPRMLHLNKESFIEDYWKREAYVEEAYQALRAARVKTLNMNLLDHFELLKVSEQLAQTIDFFFFPQEKWVKEQWGDQIEQLIPESNKAGAKTAFSHFKPEKKPDAKC